MPSIQISLSEVAETASKIRNSNQLMYQELQQMQKEMNLLDGSWVSDASQEIRTRFNLFATRFEKQKATIDQYAQFLDLTVSSYETLENTITSNASNMQY